MKTKIPMSCLRALKNARIRHPKTITVDPLSSQAKLARGVTIERGRSMVEMLGVLAIVGILSAGAMAGYSKAMGKHKINQTIDAFTKIVQRVIELDTKQFNEGEDIFGPDDAVKYGLVDVCNKEVAPSDQEGCRLPIGIFYPVLRFAKWEDEYAHIAIQGELFIEFPSHSVESCINFLSAHWENAIPVDLWGKNGYITILSNRQYDLWTGPKGNLISAPASITMENIIDGCKNCENSDECRIDFTFRQEY